jgi:homospermidine synthase
MPHDYILEISKPYLGNFISTSSDWTPLKYATSTFGDYAPLSLDLTDPWQFKNFLVRDRE